MKNQKINHHSPFRGIFEPSIFREDFGTNLSINVLAKPPTIGIFPTNPYTAPLFLLNKFLKKLLVFSQNVGFLVFWFNEASEGGFPFWFKLWSAARALFRSFKLYAVELMILFVWPLMLSSLINLSARPVKFYFPKSINRSLKSILIENKKVPITPPLNLTFTNLLALWLQLLPTLLLLLSLLLSFYDKRHICSVLYYLSTRSSSQHTLFRSFCCSLVQLVLWRIPNSVAAWIPSMAQNQWTTILRLAQCLDLFFCLLDTSTAALLFPTPNRISKISFALTYHWLLKIIVSMLFPALRREMTSHSAILLFFASSLSTLETWTRTSETIHWFSKYALLAFLSQPHSSHLSAASLTPTASHFFLVYNFQEAI